MYYYAAPPRSCCLDGSMPAAACMSGAGWPVSVCLYSVLRTSSPFHTGGHHAVTLRNAGGFGPSPANSQQAQPFHSQPPTQPSDTPSPMGGESVSICPRPGHMRTVWALRVAGRLRFPSPISHALPSLDAASTDRTGARHPSPRVSAPCDGSCPVLAGMPWGGIKIGSGMPRPCLIRPRPHCAG